MTTFSPNLAQAYQAQQRGDLDAAEKVYLSVLAEQPRNHDALHLLGVLNQQRNKPDEAEGCFRRAIEAAPSHPAAYFSLGRLLNGRGRFAEAEEVLRRSVAIAEGAAPVHSELGVSLHGQGKYEEAVAAFTRSIQLKNDVALTHFRIGNSLNMLGRVQPAMTAWISAARLKPDYAEAYYNLGMAMRATRQHADSVKAFKRALDLRPGWTDAAKNLGAALIDSDRAPDAVTVLREAMELAPDDPGLNLNLGNALMARGSFEEAASAFTRAAELSPKSGMPRVGLGYSMRARQRIEEALAAFEDATRVDPHCGLGYYALADLLERNRRPEEARAAVDKALTIIPEHPLSVALMASLERQEKRLDSARAMLERVLASNPPHEAMGAVHTELGRVLDDMGESAGAFEHFRLGQEYLSTSPDAKAFPITSYPPIVEGCRQRITSDVVATWPDAPPDDGIIPPIFFVGFPRSGTTLMEQLFAAHPGLITTGEIPILNEVLTRMPEMTGFMRGYPELLDDLSESDVRELRALFVRSAVEKVSPEAATKRIVDKQPMNLTHLGTIRRLFPDSPIVVALRDPRDVCLSCFMQEFMPNAVTVHFFTIETTAQMYAMTMDLWLHYKRTLGARCIEYRYEDLLDDNEGVARRVFDFAGITWTDEILRYFEKARSRYVTTPSYRDVAQPMHKRAVGRWKAYEAQMRHVLPILEPYVEAFGYA